MTTAPSTTPVTADLWGDADGLGRRQVALDVAAGTAFEVVVGALQLQLLPWTALPRLRGRRRRRRGSLGVGPGR